MRTLTAQDAVKISTTQAKRISAETKKREHAEELAHRKKVREEKLDFTKRFEAVVETYIESAVRSGETHTGVKLFEDRRDMWFATGHAKEKVWGLKEFEKYARFAPQVLTIMKKLDKRGFSVDIICKSTKHDETSAYMNSGGECGSKEPWYTDDTMLYISWGKVEKK